MLKWVCNPQKRIWIQMVNFRIALAVMYDVDYPCYFGPLFMLPLSTCVLPTFSFTVCQLLVYSNTKGGVQYHFIELLSFSNGMLVFVVGYSCCWPSCPCLSSQEISFIQKRKDTATAPQPFTSFLREAYVWKKDREIHLPPLLIYLHLSFYFMHTYRWLAIDSISICVWWWLL